MTSFQQKSVIVTGAGSGIGYEICHQFATRGAFVALNDINPTLAEEAASKINQEVGEEQVIPYCFDVANTASLQKAIHSHAEKHARLDIVVANAGLTDYGSALQYMPESFDRLMNVNLRGSYFTAQYAAKEMIARNTKNGRIILMSSVAGAQAIPNLGAYGISKAGIIHMTRVLALELGNRGITVNAICPGATLTERTKLEDPDYADNWARVIPTGRVVDVKDIASAVKFLASQDSGQITGQNLYVDGGWKITSPVPDQAIDNPQSGN